MNILNHPHANLSYEQRHISEFKDFDWSKATKADAVSFARAAGFRETGMSVGEIALLYDLLEQKRPKTIVELGRNYGCSTRIFMQSVIRHGGVLDSWDLKHWPGYMETMRENGYDHCNLGRGLIHNGIMHEVVIREAHSIKTDMPPYLVERGVDFLLIDTEHGIENLLPEYCRWREYLNGGAMIAFHDSTLPKVKRGIEMCIEMEESDRIGRLKTLHSLEQHDGFGIAVLEWA